MTPDYLIKVIDPRQCGDVLPIRQSVGSGLVVEHICTMPKGHPGFHRDNNGAVWVNQEYTMRQRGIE
jgi:hypothetical protein